MTRRAGLDTATVVFTASEIADTTGFEGLSLATVAETLGVKVPSLYNHVAGIVGLRRELALTGTRMLGATLTRAAIGRAEDDAVMSMANAYREFVKRHPGLYAAGVQAADPADKELGLAEAEVVDTVLRVLSAYGLRGDEAIHAVRGLRSVLHGFSSLEAGGGFGLPLNLDTSFSRLVQIYISGLRAAAHTC